MNQNKKNEPRRETGGKDDRQKGSGGPKQGKQHHERRPERGGLGGSGDAREQQDQEEFDRGGQRHGQHSDSEND